MTIAPIDGRTSPVPSSRPPPRPAFAVSPPRSEVANATSEARAVPLASMLVLQSSAERGDAAARRGAQRLLATLSRVQRALLRGRVSAAGLAGLAREVAALPEADDPALRAAAAAIALRAEVELAKAARDG